MRGTARLKVLKLASLTHLDHLLTFPRVIGMSKSTTKRKAPITTEQLMQEIQEK